MPTKKGKTTTPSKKKQPPRGKSPGTTETPPVQKSKKTPTKKKQQKKISINNNNEDLQESDSDIETRTSKAKVGEKSTPSKHPLKTPTTPTTPKIDMHSLKLYTSQTIGNLFDQAQKSFTTHGFCKNELFKLFRHLEKSCGASAREKGVDMFHKTFLMHTARLLLVYKREPAVERLVNFIIGFAHFLRQKLQHPDANPVEEPEQEPEYEEDADSRDDDSDDESPRKKPKPEIVMSFAMEVDDGHLDSFMTTHLLERVNDADKAIRFRTCQLIAGLVNNMETIEYIEEEIPILF